MLSLAEYDSIAKILIRGYLRKNSRAGLILKNADMFNYVVTRLMWADWRFTEEKWPIGGTYEQKKYQFRMHVGNKAVINILKRYNKSRVSHLIHPTTIGPLEELIQRDEVNIKKKAVRFLLNNSGLTTTQKQHISSYYLEDMTLEQAGEKHGVSKQRIFESINLSLIKLKQTVGIFEGQP